VALSEFNEILIAFAFVVKTKENTLNPKFKEEYTQPLKLLTGKCGPLGGFFKYANYNKFAQTNLQTFCKGS
jgi:hypothetical protein